MTSELNLPSLKPVITLLKKLPQQELDAADNEAERMLIRAKHVAIAPMHICVIKSLELIDEEIRPALNNVKLYCDVEHIRKVAAVWGHGTEQETPNALINVGEAVDEPFQDRQGIRLDDWNGKSGKAASREAGRIHSAVKTEASVLMKVGGHLVAVAEVFDETLVDLTIEFVGFVGALAGLVGAVAGAIIAGAAVAATLASLVVTVAGLILAFIGVIVAGIASLVNMQKKQGVLDADAEGFKLAAKDTPNFAER